MCCIVLNIAISLSYQSRKKNLTQISKYLKIKIMKKQSQNLFSEVTKSELDNLTTSVQEIIAFGYKSNDKRFTTADLWNIQRQQKSRTQRRFSF